MLCLKITDPLQGRFIALCCRSAGSLLQTSGMGNSTASTARRKLRISGIHTAIWSGVCPGCIESVPASGHRPGAPWSPPEKVIVGATISTSFTKPRLLFFLDKGFREPRDHAIEQSAAPCAKIGTSRRSAAFPKNDPSPYAS